IAEADPTNENSYKKNLEEYREKLAEWDRYIKEKTAEIPEEQRVLITAHDAFGYFGKAYGYEVRGLQGISTATEAGTADVSALADFISEKKIKAVFVESSLPVKNIQALTEAVKSRGFETSLGGLLYSDSIGDSETGTDTFISAFKHNADVITSALIP
ncbi:MAG: zinc ABC transporter substrate-binding protein, partial [Ruminiclostridium sp.]|nr:zinc ABC transporter substrate-binding protein [Ruminiclostridium sp.]